MQIRIIGILATIIRPILLMLKYRNFGKKSLNEIKEKLSALGLTLGMKVEGGVADAPVDATAELLSAPAKAD